MRPVSALLAFVLGAAPAARAGVVDFDSGDPVAQAGSWSPEAAPAAAWDADRVAALLKRIEAGETVGKGEVAGARKWVDEERAKTLKSVPEAKIQAEKAAQAANAALPPAERMSGAELESLVSAVLRARMATVGERLAAIDAVLARAKTR